MAPFVCPYVDHQCLQSSRIRNKDLFENCHWPPLCLCRRMYNFLIFFWTTQEKNLIWNQCPAISDNSFEAESDRNNRTSAASSKSWFPFRRPEVSGFHCTTSRSPITCLMATNKDLNLNAGLHSFLNLIPECGLRKMNEYKTCQWENIKDWEAFQRQCPSQVAASNLLNPFERNELLWNATFHDSTRRESIWILQLQLMTDYHTCMMIMIIISWPIRSASNNICSAVFVFVGARKWQIRQSGCKSHLICMVCFGFWLECWIFQTTMSKHE